MEFNINHFKENSAVTLLIISSFLTEVHSIFRKIDPSIGKEKRDWFLSRDFKMEMEVQYYIKMLFDNLFVLTLIFLLVMTTKYRKVYWAALVYMIYPIFDFLSFIWNYKDTAEIYWVLLTCIATAVLIIIFHKTKMKAV